MDVQNCKAGLHTGLGFPEGANSSQPFLLQVAKWRLGATAQIGTLGIVSRKVRNTSQGFLNWLWQLNSP